MNQASPHASSQSLRSARIRLFRPTVWLAMLAVSPLHAAPPAVTMVQTVPPATHKADRKSVV